MFCGRWKFGSLTDPSVCDVPTGKMQYTGCVIGWQFTAPGGGACAVFSRSTRYTLSLLRVITSTTVCAGFIATRYAPGNENV